MGVRYKELDFKTEEARLKAVRHIEENAEVSLPRRVVRVGLRPYRAVLHRLKDQYFLVHRPRAVELLPRVWLITIPGFRLCEIPVGKKMQVCNRRVRAVAVRGEELVYVCDYHGSGMRVFRGVFERQLKPVPESLCIRFCPQCIRMGDVEVGWKRLPVYECRAFMPVLSEKEEVKRRRSFKGMGFLCLQDWWWRAYLRRRG